MKSKATATRSKWSRKSIFAALLTAAFLALFVAVLALPGVYAVYVIKTTTGTPLDRVCALSSDLKRTRTAFAASFVVSRQRFDTEREAFNFIEFVFCLDRPKPVTSRKLHSMATDLRWPLNIRSSAANVIVLVDPEYAEKNSVNGLADELQRQVQTEQTLKAERRASKSAAE